MKILNKIFGTKPNKEIQYKYNSYHTKHGDEDIFVYQRFISNFDLNSDDPYKAKVIAIFRNIQPKKGISNIDFNNKNPIVLYNPKEIDRYMSIFKKRTYS